MLFRSGNREYVPAMALAAKAFGATGYFFEVHPNPDMALSARLLCDRAANYGSIIIGVPDDGTIRFSKNMSVDVSFSGFRHLVNCPYTYEPSRRLKK